METKKQFEAELKSARANAKEYREMLERNEALDLEKYRKQEEARKLALCQSLLRERTELEGRVLRIDQRIRALGYLAPGDKDLNRS